MNPVNLYTGSSEHSFELAEPDAKAFNLNQFDKKRVLEKNLINLNDKKMFLNRNLIYESASNLSGLPNGALSNQSNGQLNTGTRSNRSHLTGGQLSGGQLNGGQLNGSQISQLNHHVSQLNNPQLNSHQLNGQAHLIGQEGKQNNSQVITGNAYSNYPFNVHEAMVTGRCLPF